MKSALKWPRSVTINDMPVEVRFMERADAEAMLAFAAGMAPHDLLFLQRDIRNPKVVAAWVEQIERGLIRSLLAVGADGVLGCAAIVRDELSWSPHVAEIRVLIAPEARRGGLGRLLAQDSVALAQSEGVEKLFVRMTPDQGGAMSVFEQMGFMPEALLRNHVREDGGETHDIAILALDLKRQSAKHAVYGVGTGD